MGLADEVGGNPPTAADMAALLKVLDTAVYRNDIDGMIAPQHVMTWDQAVASVPGDVVGDARGRLTVTPVTDSSDEWVMLDEWVPTHRSLIDGSEVRVVGRSIGNRRRVRNENGDQFMVYIDEWEVIQ